MKSISIFCKKIYSIKLFTDIQSPDVFERAANDDRNQKNIESENEHNAKMKAIVESAYGKKNKNN